VYLAKVDNAATAAATGQKWFKIAERGVNNGVWAVDEMISAGGWHYFDMPSCVAPGQYLMRVELLALHSAYSAGGAQFYMECAQIEVTGSGTNTGSNLVSFPGAYPANDPGIVINIYDNAGNPTNGGRAYDVPGPDPITCSAGPATTATSPYTMPPTSSTTTTKTTSSTSTKTSTSTTTTQTSTGSVALYGQCGGQGYTGPTTCAQGTCKYSNDWYSQCLM
jgi:cellulase